MKKWLIYWEACKMLYSMVLRDLLLKAIDDPNQEWDDWVLSICDKVFGHVEA